MFPKQAVSSTEVRENLLRLKAPRREDDRRGRSQRARQRRRYGRERHRRAVIQAGPYENRSVRLRVPRPMLRHPERSCQTWQPV